MITMQTLLEQLSHKQIADTLVSVMLEKFPDFEDEHKKYTNARNALRKELRPDTYPSVENEADAIQRQIASELLFSGMLGLKDNLDHFLDPISRSFLDVDPETYLRENTVRCLPDYIQAQTERQRFYDSLTDNQRVIYEDVISYVSYLETIGPKLAHYYGFILGNELLCRIVPGYRPDTVLTMRYRRMIDSYLFQR